MPARRAETRRDGSVWERTLANAEALAETLHGVFGLEPPAPAAAIFAKIAGR
jgi:hypothetical protein